MALACKQIQTEFSALLDDELDVEDRELVEEHLAECADCLRELHGFQQVTDAYRYHHPVNAPDDFEERLRDALAPAAARHTLPWPVWKFAAAAVVLLGISLSLWRISERDANTLLATKSMPEVASEAITDATSPAPPKSLPVAAPEEADLGRSLNDMAVADDADADGVIVDETLPMEEAEGEDEHMAGGGGAFGAGTSDSRSRGVFGGGGGELPKRSRLMKQDVSSLEEASVATPTPARRQSTTVSDTPLFSAMPESPPPAPKPMAETLVATEEPAPADITPQLVAESSLMEDKPNANAIESGVLEAKKEKRSRAATSVEEDASPPLQWRKRSFVLRDGILQQAGYEKETLERVAIPSEAWVKLLDRFPDLVKLVDGTQKVIVKLDKTWYQIAASDSTPLGASPKKPLN